MSELSKIVLVDETASPELKEEEPNIVYDCIVNFLHSKNSRLKLDNKSVEIINRIMMSFPSVISDMDTHVGTIMSDNVVDMNDLPQLILMAKDIINLNAKDLKSIKITRGESITFIKDVLFILIDSNVIKTQEGSKDSILALLNLSIQMLETTIDLSETIQYNKWCCF